MIALLLLFGQVAASLEPAPVEISRPLPEGPTAPCVRIENTRVTNYPGTYSNPALISDAGGYLYIVFEYEAAPGDHDIYCARSEDRGASWRLVPIKTTTEDNRHPSIAVDPAGVLYVVYDGTPYFEWCKSADRGLSWQRWTIQAFDWFKDCSYPSLAIADVMGQPRYWIAAQYAATSTNADIRVIYSLDGSAFYDPGSPVATMADERRPQAAIAGSYVTIAYEYDRTGSGTDYDIQGTRSKADSYEFAAVKIAETGGTDEAEPRVAVSGNGLYVAYTVNHTDIGLARSADGGATFQAGTVAGTADREVHGAVAAAGPAVALAYVKAGKNVASQFSPDNGATFGEPALVTSTPAAVDTPYACTALELGDSTYIAWVDKRNGGYDIYFGTPGSTGPTTDEELAYDSGIKDSSVAVGHLAGDKLAVRLTPTFYPCYLKSARLYMSGEGQPRPCRISVAANAAGNRPDTTAYIVSPIEWSTPATFRWDSVDLARTPLPDSADFWLIFHFLPPNFAPPYVGADHEVMAHRSFWFANDAGWNELDQGNLMMRVTITHTGAVMEPRPPVAGPAPMPLRPTIGTGPFEFTGNPVPGCRPALTIFGPDGRVVERVPAGARLRWPAGGAAPPPGVYFYRLDAGRSSLTGKLILLSASRGGS